MKICCENIRPAGRNIYIWMDGEGELRGRAANCIPQGRTPRGLPPSLFYTGSVQQSQKSFLLGTGYQGQIRAILLLGHSGRVVGSVWCFWTRFSKCALLMTRRQSRDYEDQRGSLKLRVCREKLNFDFQTMLHKREENTTAKLILVKWPCGELGTPHHMIMRCFFLPQPYSYI